MKFLSFTMPAALLLMLCVACNRANSPDGSGKEAKADIDLLNRQTDAGKTGRGDAYKPANTDREAEKIMANGAAADSATVATDENASPQAPGAGQPKQGGQPAGGTPVHAQSPIPNPDWDKKIIKTANLNVEVKNYHSYNEALHRKIREAGGYIAQEEQNQSSYKTENTVVIKVPVDRFDEAISQLASDSDKLVGKKISSEDVTMQIIDTRSRLETKKEVRLRYLELLRQASKMKDIPEVQNEINNIQEEIDGATGRIAYLGHAAAYSTINLDYYQVLDASVKEDPEPGFFHRLKGALAEGWNEASSVLIGLISIWPLLAAGVLTGMGIRKWRGAINEKIAKPVEA